MPTNSHSLSSKGGGYESSGGSITSNTPRRPGAGNPKREKERRYSSSSGSRERREPSDNSLTAVRPRRERSFERIRPRDASYRDRVVNKAPRSLSQPLRSRRSREHEFDDEQLPRFEPGRGRHYPNRYQPEQWERARYRSTRSQDQLQKENQALKDQVAGYASYLQQLQDRISVLEKSLEPSRDQWPPRNNSNHGAEEQNLLGTVLVNRNSAKLTSSTSHWQNNAVNSEHFAWDRPKYVQNVDGMTCKLSTVSAVEHWVDEWGKIGSNIVCSEGPRLDSLESEPHQLRWLHVQQAAWNFHTLERLVTTCPFIPVDLMETALHTIRIANEKLSFNYEGNLHLQSGSAISRVGAYRDCQDPQHTEPVVFLVSPYFETGPAIRRDRSSELFYPQTLLQTLHQYDVGEEREKRQVIRRASAAKSPNDILHVNQAWILMIGSEVLITMSNRSAEQFAPLSIGPFQGQDGDSVMVRLVDEHNRRFNIILPAGSSYADLLRHAVTVATGSATEAHEYLVMNLKGKLFTPVMWLQLASSARKDPLTLILVPRPMTKLPLALPAPEERNYRPSSSRNSDISLDAGHRPSRSEPRIDHRHSQLSFMSRDSDNEYEVQDGGFLRTASRVQRRRTASPRSLVSSRGSSTPYEQNLSINPNDERSSKGPLEETANSPDKINPGDALSEAEVTYGGEVVGSKDDNPATNPGNPHPEHEEKKARAGEEAESVLEPQAKKDYTPINRDNPLAIHADQNSETRSVSNASNTARQIYQSLPDTIKRIARANTEISNRSRVPHPSEAPVSPSRRTSLKWKAGRKPATTANRPTSKVRETRRMGDEDLHRLPQPHESSDLAVLRLQSTNESGMQHMAHAPLPFFRWRIINGSPSLSGEQVDVDLFKILNHVNRALVGDLPGKLYEKSFRCSKKNFLLRQRYHLQISQVGGSGAVPSPSLKASEPLQTTTRSMSATHLFGFSKDTRPDAGSDPVQKISNKPEDDSMQTNREAPHQARAFDHGLLVGLFQTFRKLASAFIPSGSTSDLHNVSFLYWGSLDCIFRQVKWHHMMNERAAGKYLFVIHSFLEPAHPAIAAGHLKKTWDSCDHCRSGAIYPSVSNALQHLHDVHWDCISKRERPYDDPCLAWIHEVFPASPSAHLDIPEDSIGDVEQFFRELQQLQQSAYELHSLVATTLTGDHSASLMSTSTRPLLPRALITAFSKIVQLTVLRSHVLSLHNRLRASPENAVSTAGQTIRRQIIDLLNREYTAVRQAQSQLDRARRDIILMGNSKAKVSSFGVEQMGIEYLVLTLMESIHDQSPKLAMEAPTTKESQPTLLTLYQKYLTKLRYQAYRRPRRRVFLDIYDLEEEINALQSIIESQDRLVGSFLRIIDPSSWNAARKFRDQLFGIEEAFAQSQRAKLREKADEFAILQGKSAALKGQVKQTIEILEEDHGKAIRVFTIVTLFFLPLSFVSSFFGMNTSDISDIHWDQRIFWAISIPLTLLVVFLAIAYGYKGEEFADWLTDKAYQRKARGSQIPRGLGHGRYMDLRRSSDRVGNGIDRRTTVDSLGF